MGKLDLPRGVAESASRADGGGAGAAAKGGGPGGTASRSSRSPHGGTRWELGSAIGDNWEALFSEVRGPQGCFEKNVGGWGLARGGEEGVVLEGFIVGMVT